MHSRPESSPTNRATPLLLGSALGTFIASLLGVPLSVILLLVAISAAYACRWRIVFVRKPPEHRTSTGR